LAKTTARGGPTQLSFQIASRSLPAYSNFLMGQQHRVSVKRKRRKAYLERKRTSATATRRPSTKSAREKAHTKPRLNAFLTGGVDRGAFAILW
jgi:hypothetical protein